MHTQELLDLLVKCENKIQTVGGQAGRRVGEWAVCCPVGAT